MGNREIHGHPALSALEFRLKPIYPFKTGAQQFEVVIWCLFILKDRKKGLVMYNKRLGVGPLKLDSVPLHYTVWPRIISPLLGR